MTNTSYFQRLIARMQPPAIDTAVPFTPPAAGPPVYDPFMEAEPAEGGLAPMPEVAPPEPIVTHGQPIINITELSQQPAPLETVERVVHEFVESAPVEKPVPFEVQPHPDDLLPPEHIAEVQTISERLPPIELPVPQVATQIEQVLLPSIEAEPVSMQEPVEAPQPLLYQETIEQVLYKFIELPAEQPPMLSLEPSVESAAPAVGSAFEPPAPQITIGDIVVEIVNRPEPPARASSPPARAARPAEAPASPRLGVRSKRGYGMGQM